MPAVVVPPQVVAAQEQAKKKKAADKIKNRINQSQIVPDNINDFIDNHGQWVDSQTGKPVDLSQVYTATGGEITNQSASTPGFQTNAPGSAFEADAKEYYIATDKQGNSYLAQTPGTTNRLPIEKAIYVDPTDPTRYKIGSPSEVKERIIADYAAKPNGINQLKDMLLASKQLKKASYVANGQLTTADEKALLNVIRSNSRNNWRSYVDSNYTVKQFSGVDSYLGTFGPTTTSSISRNYTLQSDATNELSQFLNNIAGLKPDAALAGEYYNQLHALESKKTSREVVTRDAKGNVSRTSTGGGVTQEDKAKLMYGILKKAVKNTPFEAMVKNGGKAIQDADTLTKFASDYGYKIDMKDAVNRVLNTYTLGGDVRAEQEKIKQATKTMYPHLSQAIDGGSSLKDIANQYMYTKSQLMETPMEGITLFDNDIQKALNTGGKLMGLNDFQIMLRNNPLWGKTKNAREEASSYASSILKSFGMMA